MFNFLHRSASRYPGIRQVLVNSGLVSSIDADALGIVKKHGSYSGRGVTFFRAFKPTDATASAIQVRTYADLDTHPELVQGSGHVESNGLVMLNSQPEQTHVTPIREPANRSAHADDHRLVFWDAEVARASQVAVSKPAAAWLQAQSRRDERHIVTAGRNIPDAIA
jgi:hypothetical protein